MIGICYEAGPGNNEVSAYSDADCASYKETRRSTSGIMLMMKKSSKIFKSKLQQGVALKTAESEYIAVSFVQGEC